MNEKCYICEAVAEKEIKMIFGEELVANIYYIKSGFFSKEKIIICIPCKRHLKVLTDNKLNYLSGNTYMLSKDIISKKNYYIDKIKKEKVEKEKKRQEEIAALPIVACSICKKKDKGLRIVKCINCDNEYCNSCIRKYLDKNDKDRQLILKDGFSCESCFYSYKEKFGIKIIKLLEEKGVKMPASDVDAFLKHQNVDEIKEFCEDMYHNGEISRTANYRYFILSEEKKKPKKTSAAKSEKVDVKAELKKYKEMLDEGLITQEAYDSKMNQLLGL